MTDQPVVIVRRRGGEIRTRHEIDSGGSRSTQQLLGVTASSAKSTLEKVALAHKNLLGAIKGSGSITSTVTLRPDQRVAYEAFDQFLLEQIGLVEAMRLTDGRRPDWGRYVEPPRTGKTVIMGELIAGTQATALILVPTQDLVNQTRRELQAQLPHVQIGVYYGNEKNLVSNGVMVATYQIVQAQFENDTLPEILRKLTMIFCDEGHKAMSPNRLKMLEGAFDKECPVVFFTATPDYNELKTLATIAPRLIHETTIPEGFARNLFAPIGKIEVVSVDEDGSRIPITKGDYDKKALSDLMAKYPFLEAARKVRYEIEDNRDQPALICCKSRAQARLVHEYLVKYRPAGSPEPKLMLGETRGREEILRAFENGAIDTLINVSVLIEGWNSPRCALLIDLDPGLSEVESKQKYFRVMTRFGDKYARIYLVLPRRLSRVPIFPHILFGLPLEVHGYEDWMRRQKIKRPRKPDAEKGARKTAEEIKDRKIQISTSYRFDPNDILIDPHDKDRVVKIILEYFPRVEVSPPWSRSFFNTWIETSDFRGFGTHLVRFCGFLPSPAGYWRFLKKYLPTAVASKILLEGKQDKRKEESVIDAAANDNVQDHYANPWSEDYDLHKTVETQGLLRRLYFAFEEILTERHKYVLTNRFGLDGDEEKSFAEISKEMSISRERVRQIEREAMTRLRIQAFQLNYNHDETDF